MGGVRMAFRGAMHSIKLVGVGVASVVATGVTSCAPDRPAGAPPPAPSAVPAASTREAGAMSRLAYPATRRVDVKETLHGVEVRDAYRWLEDGQASEVQAWMHAQDSFARDFVKRIAVRDAIASRFRELAHTEEQWLPRRHGKRLFYSRRAADRERAVVYWREGDGGERVLLDPDVWAADKSLSLGLWSVSADGAKVAYQVRPKNGDTATLRVMDVATGKTSDLDVIDGAINVWAQWTPKADGFYYEHTPTEASASRNRAELQDIRFHKLGTNAARDPIVRAPLKGQTGCYSRLSPNGRWLIARVWYGEGRIEVYFQDLREARPIWRTLVAGRDAVFDVRVLGDTFYVRSLDGAPNGEVYAVDPRTPERSAWRRIVPERPDLPLMGFDLLGGSLILRYRKDDIAHVEIHALDGKLVRELPMHGVGTTTFPEGTPGEDEAYYGFWSYNRPLEIYRTSIKTGAETLWFQTHVPADLSRIDVTQIFYTSKDRTRIPLFIVAPKDAKRDGNAPTILFGYGGFNLANVPYFDPSIIPWVERGGIYALASIRGGNDYGETWHRAGMRHNKQNVFDDFIGAAEYLVRERYTRPERLVSSGASNGGLLVAAALVQRPDLFRAVLCGEPLTDMLRFHLFRSSGVPEFGSPDDPDDFRALFAYSPYHHVVAGTKYPSVLVTSAANDERADSAHARKFAAALQAASSSGPVLLRVDWDAGHLGSDSVMREAEKEADRYAFALQEVGAAAH
jgi:prolyl oligopeptidase